MERLDERPRTAPDGLLPRTVLLVDDDEGLRGVLEEVLAMAVERVLVAADGVAALDVLATVGPVDLLVSDVRMPGMTGLELARRCRQRDPQLKVLFMSGSDLVPIRTDERTAFLPKPALFADVIGAVRSMLSELPAR
jgi:two-component system, OmpR family, response regulator MprA